MLRRILERNIVGVDVEPHAVRTAVFSLYLALCDEIDPKYYWKTVRFPRLRDKRLIAGDFFATTTDEALVQAEATEFDLIVGNAPWGKNTLTQPGADWAVKNDWPTPYGQIGPLFLPKCAALCAATRARDLLNFASNFLPRLKWRKSPTFPHFDLDYLVKRFRLHASSA